MRITVEVPSERNSSYHGRRRKTRTEVGGPFNVVADTDALARAEISRQLAWYVQQSATPNVVTFGAYTSVMYASPAGWYTVVTGPDCGRSYECGHGTFDEASARQRYLLVQRATADWLDDADVKAGHDFLRRHWIPKSITEWRPEEHLRYAGWQRAYRAAETQGVPDCHEWATRHQSEYTPHFGE